MTMSRDRLWFSVLACVGLLIMGLLIAVTIVVALVPVYLQNRATGNSKASVTIFTVRNVRFVSSSNSGGGRRSIRSALATPAPTSNFTSSAQAQLNILFNTINAQCVISEASMPSINALLLTLQIYFRLQCDVCDGSRLQLIKQILTNGQTITVDRQYSTDCSISPVDAGSTVMTLQSDASSLNDIALSTQTSTQSLVQATDLCASTTKCVQFLTDTVDYRFTSSQSQNYTYYCIYWIPPSGLSNPYIEFAFQIQPGAVVYLDDVSLNSTVSLIQDGGFEAGVSSEYSSEDGPWVYICNSTSCPEPFVQDGPRSGLYSFRVADGTNYLVYDCTSQSGQVSTAPYYLGFWLKSNCTSSSACSFIVAAANCQSS